jgi:hypothetical protein
MILIATRHGQLANRLFLFAHFIACARERGLKVVNLSFDEYAGWFDSTRPDFWCRYPAKKSLFATCRRTRHAACLAVEALARLMSRFRWLRLPFIRTVVAWDETYDIGSDDFARLARGRLVLARGWLFRDAGHFEKHAEAIREFFRPVGSVERNVSAVIGKARAGCDVLVGVHVRQGDYREHEGGKYFYETERYLEVMRRGEGLFPGKRVGFLVCSNVAQDATKFAGLRVTFAGGHFLEDMLSLARADYIMGPPSTYSMWASFYGSVPLCRINDPAAPVTLADFRVFHEYGEETPCAARD